MAGTLTHEEALAQIAAADATYMTGANGLDVQGDLDDRVAMVSPHTAKTNAELATGLNHTTNDAGQPVYTGGNRVTAVNDTEMGAAVATALDADDLFDKGGPEDTDYVDTSDLGTHVDSLFLIEASKQTGEKFF